MCNSLTPISFGFRALSVPGKFAYCADAGRHTVLKLSGRGKLRGLVGLPMLMTVLVAFTACATGSTGGIAEMAASRIYAESTAWSEKMSAFLDRANAAVREGTLLRNLPGWPDMEKIIRAWPSLVRFEGEQVAREKTATALAEWDQRWNSSGENIVRSFEALVKHSRQLEVERLQLVEERHDVANRQSADLLRAAATARGPEIQMYGAFIQRFAKARDDDVALLGGYGLDGLGLYQRR